MSRAVGVCLVALVATAATADPRPKGRVVRVERHRGETMNPRICDVQSDRTGNCFFGEPKLGDIITLLDDAGITGEARITEVSPFALAGRSNHGCDGLWNIKTELLRGDLSNASARAMGVVDAGMHPRNGRMIPKEQLSAPSGRSDDVPAIGFDRDGDHIPDIIVSQTSCGSNGSMCIEEWVRVDGRMVQVNELNFASCGF
jgi:hypothetical protein